MDLGDRPEEAAFRNQAREWLRANAPKGLVDRGFSLPIDDESIKILTDWQRRLHEAGYLGLSWPVEYGGQGKTNVQDAIFNEGLARSRAPGPLNLLGLSMGGPTILEHGAEEQRKRFLKTILTSEENWCQRVCESDHGS